MPGCPCAPVASSLGRGGGWKKPTGLGSQGTEPDLIRAQLEPVFPGRTLVLYWWGPLAVGIIWRKKILPPAHKGFSEARGLDLDLWTELTGDGGGMGMGAWAPLAVLSPQPLPCSRDQPLSHGYHWNSWLSVSCGSVPFQSFQD